MGKTLKVSGQIMFLMAADRFFAKLPSVVARRVARYVSQPGNSAITTTTT
ncbi:MAG TPA: hypothetical protein VMT96_00710 [Candidatus Bathyarchaeia archaeon]|nr:hypothetical protein [Candidatus Bathyarchaeia archaeon]